MRPHTDFRPDFVNARSARSSPATLLRLPRRQQMPSQYKQAERCSRKLCQVCQPSRRWLQQYRLPYVPTLYQSAYCCRSPPRHRFPLRHRFPSESLVASLFPSGYFLSSMSMNVCHVSSPTAYFALGLPSYSTGVNTRFDGKLVRRFRVSHKSQFVDEFLMCAIDNMAATCVTNLAPILDLKTADSTIYRTGRSPLACTIRCTLV